ncbi:hypothetical protein DYI37_19400 [Fulvimarina endophytica]|uniref:Uncharacterized protein n=1 Tax=Fulvimarina endophytica TaxID=2293836 RepID=A0A371WXS9_9HYPH|nr:hypothetical protein DYI37_19400 [Fulvimarina endophytica]
MRIAVLPLQYGRSSAAEINVLLICDLLAARWRSERGAGPFSEEAKIQRDQVCQAVSSSMGMSVANTELVVSRTLREIEGNLAAAF